MKLIHTLTSSVIALTTVRRPFRCGNKSSRLAVIVLHAVPAASFEFGSQPQNLLAGVLQVDGDVP